jgi:glucose-6-phosphate 1-dehydrogenase
VPVIGVAHTGWSLDQLKARARVSIDKHGGDVDPVAFEKLSRLLRYVDGEYSDPGTSQALRKALGAAQRPAHYLAIPPMLFAMVVEQLARSDARAALASSWKSPSATISSRRGR